MEASPSPPGPARRMQNISTLFYASVADRIAEMQAGGLDVIRLDVGSPDLPPTPGIIAALAEAAARADTHGYSPHKAIPALRSAWADMYGRQYGVDLDPAGEILPLLGSKEGIFHLSMAHLDPGDVALVPDPGYPTYARSTLFASGEPYYLKLLPERGYLPDLEAVPPEIARRAKILWLNYPNNPTGAVAGLEFFEEAIAFGRRHAVLVCHDAAYMQVTFDGYRAPSLLQVPGAKQLAVEFNTLSKSHNMAGWRTGAALGNPQAIRTLYNLKTHVDSGHFLPVLQASVAALTGDQDWLQGRNETYRQRRDLVVAALGELGFSVSTPRAALYVWSPVPPGWTSLEFAMAALENARVSLAPGTVFGQAGEGFVRIALTAPLERTAEAMRRLREWLGR